MTLAMLVSLKVIESLKNGCKINHVRAALFSSHDFLRRLASITEAHEVELSGATERAVAARKQVTTLQEQIANIQ